jgi:hypothetical protein
MAECARGNTRELFALFLRRQLGAGVTIARVRKASVSSVPGPNANAQ